MPAALNPVNQEIFKNRLDSICDEMGLTLLRTARSNIVRSGMDFATGVLTADGEVIGQSVCPPLHYAGLAPALRSCLNRFAGRIRPGDIFANNDPYEGGSHLPDLFVFQPVFFGVNVLAYVCAVCHHVDMGGRTPGSIAVDNVDIYQEGLRIPPVKLYDAGQPNETLFTMLEHGVRLPEMVLGDLKAKLAAMAHGEGELRSMAGSMGLDEFQSSARELLDYTERLTRQVIRTLPDGVWSFTDYIDDDGLGNGPLPVVATLSKRDDEIDVSFEGTAPQCKASINAMEHTISGLVMAVVKTVLGSLDWEIPSTAGFFRPIRVTMTKGTLVAANLPSAVACRNVTAVRACQALMAAFAQMLPDRIHACTGGSDYVGTFSGTTGVEGMKKRWVRGDQHCEISQGGFSYRDGIDAQGSGTTTCATVPVEEIELEDPVMIEEFRLIPDSEGAGKFRGGLGLCRSYRMLDEAEVYMRADRRKVPPYGLFGGGSPKGTRIVIERSGQSMEITETKFTKQLHCGDILRVAMCGAGGWGDPLERDPAAVLWDVIEEKVTQARARDTYGVVVDIGNRQVDWDATGKLRAQLAVPDRNSN